jgi:glycerophosphoryl diester phosphodiesterase
MPADAFRAGPPSGQFDNEGRRAAAPRFEAQPVQGVSSIKPGSTAGAWWALSDNGFGGKWNSSDYRLCIYLFDVRPRTEAGTDSRNALQAIIELSDPAKFFPWRLADESSEERLLTGQDADPESLVTMPDESFWIGDEFGPWLMHFSVDGELLAPPIELPDNLRSVDHPLAITRADIPRLAHSRGLEAMDLAGDNQTLVSILEGTVGGDPAKTLRVLRYDTAAGKWVTPTLIYELDADTSSLTDISLIEGNRFVAIERDDQQGDAARAKRVYSIDLDRAVPGKPLPKKLVIDLLSIGNSRGLVVTTPAGAPFRFPYLTTESIQVLDRKHVVIVNDNNYPATGGRGANVKDATEWIWLELANPL